MCLVSQFNSLTHGVFKVESTKHTKRWPRVALANSTRSGVQDRRVRAPYTVQHGREGATGIWEAARGGACKALASVEKSMKILKCGAHSSVYNPRIGRNEPPSPRGKLERLSNLNYKGGVLVYGLCRAVDDVLSRIRID